VLDTVRANEMKACYIRPILYRGYDSLGVNPLSCPVDAAIMLWEWGAYLGKEALEEGTDVKISSWSRMAPQHAAGNGQERRQLRKLRADQDGGARRRLRRRQSRSTFPATSAKAAAKNIFIVRDGATLYAAARIVDLGGITRDSVMTLARDLGYTVSESVIPREALYIADEIFFVGTAAEVTPVRSVDKQQIGAGRRGPITQALQQAFFDVINGEVPDTHGWLTYVYADEAPASHRSRHRRGWSEGLRAES